MRAMVVVGLGAVAFWGLTSFLGQSPKIDRLASERPGRVSDVPAWERTYGAERVGKGGLEGAGELQRVHVVSYLDADLDLIVLDDDEPQRPVLRGCGREPVRNSSFVAPSGRMSVPEQFPATAEGAEGLAPDEVARQIGIDDAGPHRFGVEQEIEVQPHERVEVRAFPLEERWAFRLGRRESVDGAPSQVGVSKRVVGLCFAIFRVA